jgi:hypothetical protein
MMGEESQCDVRDGAQSLCASKRELDPHCPAMSWITVGALHRSRKEPQTLSRLSFVYEWFGFVGAIRPNRQQSVNRLELMRDYACERTKSVVVRTAVNLLVRPTSAQGGREYMFARASNLVADNALLGHRISSSFTLSMEDRINESN